MHGGPAAQACVSTTCFGKFSAATRGSVISRIASIPKRIDSFIEGSEVALRRDRRRSQYSLIICFSSIAEGAEANKTIPKVRMKLDNIIGSDKTPLPPLSLTPSDLRGILILLIHPPSSDKWENEDRPSDFGKCVDS